LVLQKEQKRLMNKISSLSIASCRGAPELLKDSSD